MAIDPLKEEFLAVVTSWYTYGQKGGLVGSAIPVYCTTRHEVIADPTETFPDPGYVFLVNRGSALEWDWIVVRPKKNDKYVPGKSFFLSFDVPAPVEQAGPETRVASVLDVSGFDPAASSGLIRNPSQNVLPVFFARNNRRLYGPLRRVKVSRKAGGDALDGIQWAPLADDSSVYEFGEDDLLRHGLTKLAFKYDNPDNEAIASAPIYLLTGAVLTAKSERAHDRLSPSELADWFLRWREMANVPESVLKALRAAPEYLSETTPEVIRQRCRRLAGLFGTLDVLQSERSHAAANYLESEAGQKQIRQLMDREVERKAGEIDKEVARLKKDQSKEKYDLQRETDTLRVQHENRKKLLREEMAILESERVGAAAAVESIQKQIASGVESLTDRLQAELPVFAAMSAGLRPTMVIPNGTASHHSPTSARDRPSWGAVSIPAPTKDLEAVTNESGFVDRLAWELADEGLYFTRDFLANLYVTLKASALNLVMGPPGYGKSSVVSALSRAMGHGNALLEIAVRRTWSDDRYLLGFYDTFHGRYDPGPTGLATRLLEAQRDWEENRTGLYLILLDEFNLAAPEYYFSQLLQLLTRPTEQERVLRLYDSATTSETAVDRLRLHPNVRFWGTINYDETTERLSPRLLDRTGMIFLGPRDVVPATGSPPGSPGKGILAKQLIERFVRGSGECPEDAWQAIEPLLTSLRKPSDEFGAGIDLSPRVLEAIRRYLSNAMGLLPAARAADFVFEQRVLPALRGRGPKFAARVRSLAERLTERGFDRSAVHVQEALALAEVNFGDVDFLAY